MTNQISFELGVPEQLAFKQALVNTSLTPKETCRLFVPKTIATGDIPFELSQPSTCLMRGLNSCDYRASVALKRIRLVKRVALFHYPYPTTKTLKAVGQDSVDCFWRNLLD